MRNLYISSSLVVFMADITDAEKVGFYKGCLSTLTKEREELLRIVAITEQLMQVHVKALKDLGVDLLAEQKKAQTKKSEGSLDTKLKQ